METHVYPPASMTVEEYLRFEEASAERHEYVAGQVYAMTGGTLRHSLVAANIGGVLLAARRGGPCRTVMADVKVQVANDRIYYPDVVVVCTPPDQRTLVVREPCVVVEVVSPSTRRVDHSEKLDAYLRLTTLRAYLIVEQGARRVEHHWRDAANAWQHETVTDAAGGAIPIPCPEALLTLDAIYEDIQLDPLRKAGPLRLRETATLTDEEM